MAEILPSIQFLHTLFAKGIIRATDDLEGVRVMEQMTDDEDTERVNNIHGSGSKRILDEEAARDSKDGFKKARYSWQIKGKPSASEADSEPQPLVETLDEQDTAMGFDCKGEAILPPIIGGKIVSPLQSSSLMHRDEIETSTLASTSDVGIKAKPVQNQQIGASSHVHPVVQHGNSAGETQTKFEMLREMGSEYSERIEEFLKARSGRYESDSDSDDEVKRAPSFESPDDQLACRPRVLEEGQEQEAASKSGMNPDPPQPNNRHMVNISSWLWQKQELGCAIVDNVFNRTLEELGLSPDPEANLQATTRVSVENQSIEAAINQQGLAVNDVDEDSIASLAGSSNSDEQDTIDLDSFDVDACITNTEQDTTDTFSEIDEKSDSLDSILSSKNESNITDMPGSSNPESSNVDEINPYASTTMDLDYSKTSRQLNNNITEMDVCSSDNESSHRSSDVSKSNAGSSKSYNEIHESELGSSAMSVIEGNASGVDDDKKADPDQQGHGSDNLIDLAVSTAIMSQGLNIR